MNTQQIQNTFKNVQRTTGNLWLWLGIGILLFVAALAINDVSRTAPIVPITGSAFQAQSVPEAGVQSVADYIRAHSSLSAQVVPDASVQSVTDYIRLHSSEQSANQNKAHIPSYRFQLDECSDVGLSELASCRKASQKTIP